jgi:prepilin-type N-terminal cleavage/methylation domain-containing protein
MKANRSRHQAGFTLVELIVVLAMIAIVVGFAAPRIDFIHFEIQGAVQRVNSTVMAAQRTAIKRQHNVVVAFDVEGGLIRIHEDANNNRQVDPGEAIRYVDLGDHVVFGRAAAPAHPVLGEGEVSFVRTQDGFPAVIFGRGGNASEYGGLYLTSRRAALAGNRQGDDYAIEVERATGRVNWLHYGGTMWGRGF